jgi:hypothetical protein
MIKLKNLLAENMLRFGTKNLSESAIRRLTESEDPIDPAAIGFPDCPAKTVSEFVDWYIKYLTPSTGCVGQTLLIMKPEAGMDINGVGTNLVANIAGKVTVASSFNFSYRGGSVAETTGVCIWDTAATRNYDWSKQTVKIKSNETYYYPGLYDVQDMVDATLSLVPDGTINIPGTPNSIPVVIGGTTYGQNDDGSKFIKEDPISKKKVQKIQIKRDGTVAGGVQGIFPWVKIWEVMPTNFNGYGFTMAAGGTEVPMQTEASMTAWIAKNVKKGKYIGPAGN